MILGLHGRFDGGAAGRSSGVQPALQLSGSPCSSGAASSSGGALPIPQQVWMGAELTTPKRGRLSSRTAGVKDEPPLRSSRSLNSSCGSTSGRRRRLCSLVVPGLQPVPRLTAICSASIASTTPPPAPAFARLPVSSRPPCSVAPDAHAWAVPGARSAPNVRALGPVAPLASRASSPRERLARDVLHVRAARVTAHGRSPFGARPLGLRLRLVVACPCAALAPALAISQAGPLGRGCCSTGPALIAAGQRRSLSALALRRDRVRRVPRRRGSRAVGGASRAAWS